MKIIDFHVNLVPDWVKSSMNLTEETQSLRSAFAHPKLDQLNQQASWEKISQLPIYKGVCFGYQFQNYDHCERQTHYTIESLSSQDKYFGLVNLQPRDERSIELLQTAVKKPRMIGLKLKAKWGGFSLADVDLLGPYFEILQQYNKLVLVHISQNFHASQGDHLGELTAMARAFPQLKIVAAHMGGFFGVYTCYKPLQERYKNLWVDISLPANLSWLPALMRNDSLQRYLFATDFPYSTEEDFLKTIDQLDLTQNEKERLLYKNAYDLFDQMGLAGGL